MKISNKLLGGFFVIGLVITLTSTIAIDRYFSKGTDKRIGKAKASEGTPDPTVDIVSVTGILIDKQENAVEILFATDQKNSKKLVLTVDKNTVIEEVSTSNIEGSSTTKTTFVNAASFEELSINNKLTVFYRNGIAKRIVIKPQ